MVQSAGPVVDSQLRDGILHYFTASAVGLSDE